jgi:hypothetical protein
MQGPIFSHVIFVDTNISFWQFQLFYSTKPHEYDISFIYCRLIVKFVQLSMLSIMSISIQYVHFLYISIHFVNLVHYVHFYPCSFPFWYILSFLCILIRFVNSLQFVQICGRLLFVCGPLYLSIPIPLMSIRGLLCSKVFFENSFCKVDYTIKSVQLLLSFLFHMFISHH